MKQAGQRGSWKCIGFLINFIVLAMTINAMAEPVALTYANDATAPAFVRLQMDRWKAEVENRTAGEVKISILPSNTASNTRQMMDAVTNDRTDIACLNLAEQAHHFIATSALALPWGISSAQTGSRVLLALFQKYQPIELAELKVLALFTSPSLNLMAVKPLRMPAELKGLDLQAGPSTAQMLLAWNANPVGIPLMATGEAIQKGMVKGLLWPLVSLKDLQFGKFCSHVTIIDIAVLPYAVVMNQQTWQRLPLMVQETLEALKSDHSLWTGVYADRSAQEAVQWAVKSHKVEILNLTAIQKAFWIDRTRPLIDHWAEKATTAGLPAQEMISDIKAWLQDNGN